MDLKAKIFMESVISKEILLVFSKQKQKMEDRSKYLDGTLISSGHQMKEIDLDTNQGLGNHFYLFREMT